MHSDPYSAFLQSIGDAISRLGQDLAQRVEPFEARNDNLQLDPISQTKSTKERHFRQALLIAEIIDAGGEVPKEAWVRLARQHGYVGRGLAGFFRTHDRGLLQLEGGDVRVTDHGRRRLVDNIQAVRAWRVRRGASAVNL